MADREKVIKDLEECLSASCRGYKPHILCPYNDEEWDVMREALTVLKEQDAVKPKSKVRHGAYPQIQHFCGNCMTILHGKPKYCSECGKKVCWHGSDRKTLV